MSNSAFFAGCSGSDLVLVSNSHGCKRVQEGYRCLRVNNEAYVEFNETIARYYVESLDHCLMGKRIRMCMPDGYWDGKTPSFSKGKENIHKLHQSLSVFPSFHMIQ